MTANDNSDALSELDRLILTEYPYPISVNYKRLLDEQDWEKKTRACIQVFEYGLRAITLGLISQYLIRDVDRVSDPQLNKFLLTSLSRATLGTWNDIFFKALQAYQDKRNLFFMPELYDLYWDTSTSPHRPHKGIRDPFDRLVQIRNDLAHGVPPTDEASWQAKFEESFRLLRQVLGHFLFLENYDLIRIRWAEAKKYWYDIYTGLQVISPSQPFRTKENLTEGWFYLSRQEEKFLELHPLLIFWEKELVEAERERMRDAAIFDRFRRTSLDYLATVLREKINLTDRTLIAEFIHTVYYTIEKVKMPRREAKKLTWRLLKEVAEKVSSERIGDVRSKYRRQVYLQREETKRTFEEFLTSDKTCLVLIGKSGVGKSNFFLSLMDEYEDSTEVCTLMYNGARFSAETGVADALTRDFGLYLKLEGLAEREGVEDILFETNRIEGIADRKVVLLIDALNENPDARALLRRVDALVEASPYPWLKVVISSRPETWRTIKRGVRLAEHKYYREEETGELGVEMQPFSIEVEMKPFAREELPAAYAKYQEVFELQTDYEDVPTEVRQVLRDPLTLWLVAEIHRGQEIPQDIQVSELYQEYVDVLIRTERLYREDIRFLERELMPLMIREGEYANSITGETISVARTTDGKSVFELIHSDEVLSSGRRVNQSYANLVDAEILMELETDVDYEIAFKYERFYEYFGSKRLIGLRDALPTRLHGDWYLNVAKSLSDFPFLWGPFRSVVLSECQRSNYEPTLILAGTDSQLVRNLVISVLEEHGRHNPDQVSALVQRILSGTGLKMPMLKVRRSEKQRNIWIRLVGVAVAGRLLINDALLLALRSRDKPVRGAAVQETYRIWNENPERGLTILQRLQDKMPAFFRLARYVTLQSLFDVSVIILFHHFRDPQVLESLRMIWQRSVSRVLFIDKQNPGALRNRLVALLIGFAVRIIRSFGASTEGAWGPPGNLAEFSAFFRQGDDVKQRLKRLIPYLDPNHGALEDLEDDLLAVARGRDVMTMYIALLVLHGRLSKGEPEVLDTVSSMISVALEASPPSPFIGVGIVFMARMCLQNGNDCDAVLELTRSALQTHIHSGAGQYATNARVYSWIPVGHYLAAYFRQRSELDIEIVQLVSEIMHKTTNQDLLTSLAEQIAEPCEYGMPVAGIAWLRILAPDQNENIRNIMAEALSYLYAHAPEDVEDLMEELELSQSLRQQTRAQATVKMRILIFAGADLAIDRIAVNTKGSLPAHFKWWLEQTETCHDLSGWLALMVQGLINLLFDRKIFQTTQPLLSE